MDASSRGKGPHARHELADLYESEAKCEINARSHQYDDGQENDPKTGMSFQKPNIFGKSQKKSETGVTKLSTAFRVANKFSNSFTPHFFIYRAPESPSDYCCAPASLIARASL